MGAVLKRGITCYITAALILAVAQLGRLPLPASCRTYADEQYARVARTCRALGRNADVVVLGDSRIVLGIDRDELARGLRVRGRQEGPPVIVCFALYGLPCAAEERVWKRLAHGPEALRTRLVIIGLSELSLQRSTMGNAACDRFMYRASDALWLVRHGRIEDAAAVLMYRLLPLMARQAAFRNLIAGTRDPLNDPPGRHPLPDRTALSLYRGFYFGYEIDDFQVRCLQELLKDLGRRRIPTVLVTTPVALSLLRASARDAERPEVGGQVESGAPGSPLRQFKTAVRACANRAGVPYLDYMVPAYAERFEYYGLCHLRPESAKRFTRELARSLNDQTARRLPDNSASRPVPRASQ